MAWKKKTDQEREAEIREYTEKLENGIREVFSGSDQYREFLITASNLHGYSDRNIVLMLAQWQERQRQPQGAELPNVSYVAGFGQYEKMGRHVKKGEKGIKIFAPAPFKVKREEEQKDPATGRPLRGADGQILTEEVEVTITSFKVVTVFDVSQTDGAPLPMQIQVPDIEGNVRHYELFKQALMDSSPVPVTFEPMRDSLDGFFRHTDNDRSIHINDGKSEVQTVAAIVHEIAHAHLHDAKAPANETSAQHEARRNREEVEAESISFVVNQHFGIETDANSFGYVANWSSGKELSELKASLQTIQKTASMMIDTIDARFAELKKEHGIEDELADAGLVEEIPDTAATFANDYYAYMSAHNEEKGLPRYGMDEPDVVIAEITQEILNGEIPDLRDTLRHTIAGLDEGDTPPAYGGQEVDALLQRLDNLENVKRVIPAAEQEQPTILDTPEPVERSAMEQLYLDLNAFTNARRVEAGNPPYGETLEEFEELFKLGYNGQLRYSLEEWAKDSDHTEQAQALLAQLDAVEAELWPGPSVAPMRDKREQFGLDLADIMRTYYDEFSVPIETDFLTNTSPQYIVHQIEIGHTEQIESCLELLEYQPSYERYAKVFRERLSELEPLSASEFDLGYGHMGNGLAVWNRLETRDGDYAKVAHISPQREVTYHDNTLPDEVKAQIEQVARTLEMTVSATQDTPVFSTPPEPAQAEQADPPEQNAPQARRSMAHQNYTRFERLFPDILSGEYTYVRHSAGEAFMPLDVQHLFDNHYSLTHFYRQNGDSISDPDMQVIIDKEEKTLNAATFQQDNISLYQQVYDDEGRANVPLQRGLNSFLRQWLTNIENQEYQKEQAHAVVNDKVVEITFDDSGQPVMPESVTPTQPPQEVRAEPHAPEPPIQPTPAEQEEPEFLPNSDLLSLDKEKALEMFDLERTVFIIQPDGAELIAIDREDIEDHGGAFGMDEEEYQIVSDHQAQKAAVKEGESAKEKELLHGEGDRYGIYQIDNIRDVDYAFRSLAEAGNDLKRSDYTLMYTAELEPGTYLEELWDRHNRDDRPAGREMRSLSMSDVVVTKKDGELAAYYVDDFGYKEIENFLNAYDRQVHEKVENLAREVVDLLRNFEPAYCDFDAKAHASDLAVAIVTGEQYESFVKQPLAKVMEVEPDKYRHDVGQLTKRLKVFETMQPFMYYSTQRPIGIGTIPREPIPRKIKNYDSRKPVENGAFQAWGYVVYNQPLTEQQMKDYELRPSPDSHIRAAEMSTEDNYNMIDGIPNNTSPDIVETHAAVISNYAGMDAFVGADEKVYLGKQANYDNQGHYDNSDDSLVYISDNISMFYFLYMEPGWVLSQEKMLADGVHTPADYEEFAALQSGVLSNFEAKSEVMFDGKPFHWPTMAQLEQDAAEGKQVSIMDMVAAIKNEKKPSVLGDLADARLAIAERDSKAAGAREQPPTTKKDEREI